MERDEVAKLFLAGGTALIALGVGLILANPDLRRSLMPLAAMLPGILPGLGLEDGKLEKLTEGKESPLKMVIDQILPDIERYLKAKSM